MAAISTDRSIVRFTVLFLGFAGYLYFLFEGLGVPGMVLLALGATGLILFGGFIGYCLESDNTAQDRASSAAAYATRRSTAAATAAHSSGGSSGARKQIQLQMDLISSLIQCYQPRLLKYEQEVSRSLVPLSKGAVAALVCVRRIIEALEERLDVLVDGTSTIDRLGYAKTIVDSPLLCRADAQHAVLDGTDIPALRSDQWDGALSSLLGQVERELVAHRRAA